MKIRIVSILFLLPLMFSCKDDDSIITDSPGVNKWVYGTIRSNYLWSATIPPIDQTDPSVAPNLYWERYLRYRNNPSLPLREDIYGDRFSSVKSKSTMSLYASGAERAADDRVNGFGMEVRSFFSQNTGEFLFCHVMYVIPGSQAARAGVRRGDTFKIIDGKPMTASFHDETELQDEITVSFHHPRSYSAKLKRENIVNEPVIFDSIYENLSPKTGYLVYNHFTGGSSGRFNKELKQIFSRFKQQGVRNLILDLRYNGGGELSAARVLGSLMAPVGQLGQPMIYMERNKSFGESAAFEPMKFLTDSDIRNNNPGFDNIYIITLEYTASASELIIHSLKPYFNNRLVVVGNKTVGKNLGGITITNKRYRWEMSVITLRVYDRNFVSGYEAGILPDHAMSDFYQIDNSGLSVSMGDWGKPEEEFMLRRVMSLIYPDLYPNPVGRMSVTPPLPAWRTETSLRVRDLTEAHITVE